MNEASRKRLIINRRYTYNGLVAKTGGYLMDRPGFMTREGYYVTTWEELSMASKRGGKILKAQPSAIGGPPTYYDDKG